MTAGTRPAAVAALSDDLRTDELAMLVTEDELLAFVKRREASIVAIDAPLGLPRGQCCLELSCECQPEGQGNGRECERALSRLGIGSYYTTKRSIIKGMVYRGMRLKMLLEAEGRTVLEVYPYATKIRLLGKPLPRKTSALGRAHMELGLSRLLGREIGPLDHDSADALFCAYTAWLHSVGQTERLGWADEGLIHIPPIGLWPPATCSSGGTR